MLSARVDLVYLLSTAGDTDAHALAGRQVTCVPIDETNWVRQLPNPVQSERSPGPSVDMQPRCDNVLSDSSRPQRPAQITSAKGASVSQCVAEGNGHVMLSATNVEPQFPSKPMRHRPKPRAVTKSAVSMEPVRQGMLPEGEGSSSVALLKRRAKSATGGFTQLLPDGDDGQSPSTDNSPEPSSDGLSPKSKQRVYSY